ncbi:MAG: 23S rRNA (pseudouridine(1915)-N(3))-methyltransferase RlmH [Eubacterium sp.]|nr:23S rRNA (pseudouridine(1915)-N(3))-methyltransferase RlmH [Eubacterium sp.]
MKITIACVGSIKENYFRDAIEEYSKRLKAYCQLEILEVKDEKTSENMTDAQLSVLLETEAQRLEKCIPDSAYKIALCVEGKELSSEGLSGRMEELFVSGVSHLVFIIGGSVGISPRIVQNCQMKLSFSRMTFPHRLMRVILLEQIYRSFKIMKNEPYHK